MATYRHPHSPSHSRTSDCVDITPPPPLRKVQSTSAVLQRQRFIAFATTRTPLPKDALRLQRLPTLQVNVSREELCGHGRCHTICLIVERQRRTQSVSHKLTVDARLFYLLLLFSMISTVTSLALSRPHLPSRMNQPNRWSTPIMDLEDHYDAWGVSSVTQSPFDYRVEYTKPQRAFATTHAVTSKIDRFAPMTAAADLTSEQCHTTGARATAPAETMAAGEALLSTDAARVASPRRLYDGVELRKALARRDGWPTVLLYGSKLCRTCRMIQPKMQQMASTAGAKFLYIHHDRTTDDVFTEHTVTQTPTALVYDASGTLIDRAVYSSSNLAHFAEVLEGMKE